MVAYSLGHKGTGQQAWYKRPGRFGHRAPSVMERANAASYEVHVELFDDGSHTDDLDRLELLLGPNWVAPVLSGGAARMWRFTHRNDAEHAGELARGLLAPDGPVFLIWLREPGKRSRRLLGGSIEGARSDA